MSEPRYLNLREGGNLHDDRDYIRKLFFVAALALTVAGIAGPAILALFGRVSP